MNYITIEIENFDSRESYYLFFNDLKKINYHLEKFDEIEEAINKSNNKYRKKAEQLKREFEELRNISYKGEDFEIRIRISQGFNRKSYQYYAEIKVNNNFDNASKVLNELIENFEKRAEELYKEICLLKIKVISDG